MDSVEEDAQIQAHYSSLSLHRRCPQAWYYKYEVGLKEPSDRVAPERDFGIWWSALRAAEAIERGRKVDSLKAEPRKLGTVEGGPTFSMKTVTVNEVLEAAEQWWPGHKSLPDGEGGFAEDQWKTRLGGEAPTLLRKLLERHLDQWGDEIKNEHPLGVEVFWKRQLPQPKDQWVPEGYPAMTLIGFVDELYFDTERGIVVARDHKTTKKLDISSAVDDMMDSQLQLYAWGANPLVQEWGYERGIRAVAYDRAKSVSPRPPSLTNSGRLRQYKGEPTVGMMDLQTYLEWVASKPEYPGLKKDGSGAGIYEKEDAVVEKLSTPAAQSNWFQRAQMPLNRNLIQTHLRAAVDSTFDQFRTIQRSRQTLEAQRNLGAACKWCPYVKLCRAQMVGGSEGMYELDELGLIGKKGEKVLDEGVLV